MIVQLESQMCVCVFEFVLEFKFYFSQVSCIIFGMQRFHRSIAKTVAPTLYLKWLSVCVLNLRQITPEKHKAIDV